MKEDLVKVTQNLVSEEFSHSEHLSHNLFNKCIEHLVFESKHAILQYEDIGFNVQQDDFCLIFLLIASFFLQE